MSVSVWSVCNLVLFCYITGKKSNTAEKPFLPVEPPEPVLPGSSAIGSVSLAVAKTGAKIQDIPLYKFIAVLKNGKVRPHKHKYTLYIHKHCTGSSM